MRCAQPLDLGARRPRSRRAPGGSPRAAGAAVVALRLADVALDLLADLALDLERLALARRSVEHAAQPPRHVELLEQLLLAGDVEVEVRARRGRRASRDRRGSRRAPAARPRAAGSRDERGELLRHVAHQRGDLDGARVARLLEHAARGRAGRAPRGELRRSRARATPCTSSRYESSGNFSIFAMRITRADAVARRRRRGCPRRRRCTADADQQPLGRRRAPRRSAACERGVFTSSGESRYGNSTVFLSGSTGRIAGTSSRAAASVAARRRPRTAVPGAPRARARALVRAAPRRHRCASRLELRRAAARSARCGSVDVQEALREVRRHALAVEGDRDPQRRSKGPRGDLHLVQALHVGALGRARRTPLMRSSSPSTVTRRSSLRMPASSSAHHDRRSRSRRRRRRAASDRRAGGPRTRRTARRSGSLRLGSLTGCSSTSAARALSSVALSSVYSASTTSPSSLRAAAAPRRRAAPGAGAARRLRLVEQPRRPCASPARARWRAASSLRGVARSRDPAWPSAIAARTRVRVGLRRACRRSRCSVFSAW